MDCVFPLELSLLHDSEYVVIDGKRKIKFVRSALDHNVKSAIACSSCEVGYDLFITLASLFDFYYVNVNGKRKVICVLQIPGGTKFNIQTQVRLSTYQLDRLRFRMDRSMGQCVGFIKGSILIFNYAYNFEFLELLVILHKIDVQWFCFVFNPGELKWVYLRMDDIIRLIYDPGICKWVFRRIEEFHIVNFDPGTRVWLHKRREKFSRLIFDPGGDEILHIFDCIVDIAYKFNLSGKNCAYIVNVINLVRFDVGSDLRTNPFQEEGNDTILIRTTSNKANSNNSSQIQLDQFRQSNSWRDYMTI